MVLDSELVERLREFLATSDLNTTTTATVRRRLEEDLEIDLSHRKAFIRDQIDLYLQTQTQEQNNDDDDVDEENDDEMVKSEEREEDEEKNEEEGSSKRSKSKNNEVKKKRGGGGFCKLCSLSPQLQNFVGAPEMARTEVVKQLWNYIREKNLQDPSNRRNIICDETLGSLFRVKSIDMFQMNKALTKHIWPLESDDAPSKPPPPKEKKPKKERDEAPSKPPPPKEKKRKKERDEDSDEPERKKKQRKGGGGFLALIPISEPLAKFIGTGETALSRSDAVKRIWDYVKQNNLQDPSDKRRILCDEKLRELFDVDNFVGFSVSKLLTSHFIKPEK